MIKKISALILALVLCLSMMVVPASAAAELNGTQVAYALEWDQEYYNPGDTATLYLYLAVADDVPLFTGTITIGLNSQFISPDDNDPASCITAGELCESYYKDLSTNTGKSAATYQSKIEAMNTAEENATYDWYIRTGLNKNTGGSHPNAANNKDGLYGSEIDPTVPFITYTFTVSADAPMGSVIPAAITSGCPKITPIATAQLAFKYYTKPGSGTTSANIAADQFDVSNAVATAYVGEPPMECPHYDRETVHVNGAPATCTEDGYYYMEEYCLECGQFLNVEEFFVPATGHTEGDVVVENEVPATCGYDGSYDYVFYCSFCNEELSRETVVVPATGEHVYSTIVTEIRATCTEDGYVTNACGCGAENTEIIPAKGHDYRINVTAPTCTEPGYTTYTCPFCKDSYIADEVDAIGHSYEVTVVAPTCTEEGYTTHTCYVCGDSYIFDIVPATGHSYEATVVAPTCTEDGYTTYTCSVCCYSYTADVVPATGHNYVDDVCEVCGESNTTPLISVSTVSAMPGETVDVTISLVNNPGIANMLLKVGFDNSALTLTGVTDSGILGTQYHSNKYYNNPYTLNWSNDTVKENYTVNGVVVTLHFEVSESVEIGTTLPITVTYDYDDYYIYDADLNLVYFDVSNGAINVDRCNHSYVSHTVAPTCTEDGYTTYTCSYCGDSYVGDEVLATGHYFEETFVKYPTCTEAGYTTYTCLYCGDSYVGDEVEATGHYFEVKYNKYPTCVKNGYVRYQCTACGDTFDEEIPARNHTYDDGTSALVEIPAVEPTCNAPGYTASERCSICYTITKAPETIPAIDHSYDDGVVTPSTCVEHGYTTYTCVNCGDSYREELPLSDEHILVEIPAVAPTCTIPGSTAGEKCSLCNAVTVQPVEIPVIDHEWNVTSVTPPTCLKEGYSSYKCSTCGMTKRDDYIEASGHSYEGVVTAPTCTEGGYTTYTCSVCNDSYVGDETPAAGHKYVDYCCTGCGKTISADAPMIEVTQKSSAIAGKQVQVAISLKNNPGIASMLLKVNYDTIKLELDSVNDCEKLGTTYHSDSYNTPYTLCWANDTASENITYNGEIVVLTFNILEDAALGETPVTVTYDFDNSDIIDKDMKPVEFEVINGTVKIIDVIIGDVNNDGKVNQLDRVMLTRYVANWEGYTEENVNLDAADVNCDGKINQLDRVILTRFVANWEGYETLPYTK